MLKSLVIASVLGLGLAPSAYAVDAVKCDEATMTKMKTEMDAMKEPAAKKETAMKEMDMAKKAMEAKKTDECTAHLTKAMDAMKKS